MSIMQKRQRTRGGRNFNRHCSKFRKQAVHLRDGFRCVYCETDLSGQPPEKITIDHVDPFRHRSVVHEPTNLVTACFACNNSRGDKPIGRFTSAEQLARVVRQTATPIEPFYAAITAQQREQNLKKQKGI